MSLSLRLAWRYLFAKKSTNVINVITAIAGLGVAIGAAALILVLSVFNGFEDLFLGMFNDLNPDVRITAVKGKSFQIDSNLVYRLQEEVEGVEVVSQTLTETAFFEYRGNRNPGELKGVDDQYVAINRIDTMVRRGSYRLSLNNQPGAILGRQMTYALNIDVDDQFEPLRIYMARRRRSSIITGRQPFVSRTVFPAAIINTPEAFENQAVLISLDLARQLLDLPDGTVSALELKLAPGAASESTYAAIRNFMGPEFEVANRYQQESGLLSLMQIEKWIAFAIAGLMMFLISFNLIGALWMIVLEKRRDIAILQSMGMTDRDIRRVFLQLGLLICGVALVVGLILAFGIYLLQQNFNLITLPGSFDEAYPISMRLADLPIVAVVVFTIGLLAAILPARRATRIDAVVREE
ncbi:MAG: FtsX-like permease family protein [Bacteroidota bacterium]